MSQLEADQILKTRSPRITKRRLVIGGVVVLGVTAVAGAYVLGARSVVSEVGSAVDAGAKAVDAAASAA